MNKTPNNTGTILLYHTGSGKVEISVMFSDENFWLTQKTMGELFDVDTRTINYHLKEIYESDELTEGATIQINRIVQKEGSREVSREVAFYNLDAIIAVGYRVNSKKATRFRQWATTTLKEYIIKGFVLNDDMLKNGKAFGKDYFDELLERIREIRASERRAYQKVADVFEQCSADYAPKANETRLFFAFVQNKLHYAVTGQTAGEVIAKRADSTRPHMGLTSWKNSPKGKILKSDVTVAKNYLNEKEISKLNRLVSMFIDFAELQAMNGKIMTMQNWIDKTDSFLQLSDQDILKSAGKITHEDATKQAVTEYTKFREIQDKEYISDFDKITNKYLKK